MKAVSVCITAPWHVSADTEEVLQTLLHLTKLNLNGCISLSRLELPSCDKLAWLDCSGCAALHHIHVASPVLSHLQAVSCQRLVVSNAPEFVQQCGKGTCCACKWYVTNPLLSQLQPVSCQTLVVSNPQQLCDPMARLPVVLAAAAWPVLA